MNVIVVLAVVALISFIAAVLIIGATARSSQLSQDEGEVTRPQ